MQELPYTRCLLGTKQHAKKRQMLHALQAPLTRTPQPFDRLESLRGYVLRLTECNGYESPWRVYVRAGLRQFEVRGAAFKVYKLASICNCSPIQLRTIAYSDPVRSHSCCLLEEAVGTSDLDFSHPRICPECIRSFGYIQGCWDLRLMIGCPIHGTEALSFCSSCHCRLTWQRPAMLTCRCGQALGSSDVQVLKPSARALLDVIYSKTLNLLPFPDPNGRLPISQLSQMSLRKLLSTVRTLGVCWTTTFVPTGDAVDAETIVVSAAQVLSNWPENYFRLLTALAQRRYGEQYDVRRQFAPLYNALLKERDRTDSSALGFLQESFMEFIGNHQTIHAVDPRLMPEIQRRVQPRYVTRASLAKSVGVDPRTVTRLLVSEVPGSDAQRFLPVDASGFSRTGTKPSQILSVRKASARCGVPVSVFRRLLESADYSSTHRLPGQAGYDERDLNQLLGRLLAKVQKLSREKPPVLGTVSVQQIMRMNRYSVAEKVSIVAAIANGDLDSFVDDQACDFRTVSISSSCLMTFIAILRASCTTVTASDATRILGCAMETIKILIDQARIAGKKSGKGWLVLRESLDAFHGRFVKLSSIATELRTSSRRLIALSGMNQIELLCARSSARRREIFIRRDDQSRLECVVELAKRGLSNPEFPDEK
jgi:hypothetical protein